MVRTTSVFNSLWGDTPREESQKIWGPGGREAKTILKR